jgi:hypothetical protein
MTQVLFVAQSSCPCRHIGRTDGQSYACSFALAFAVAAPGSDLASEWRPRRMASVFQYSLEVCSQVLHSLRVMNAPVLAERLTGHIGRASDSARSALNAAATEPARDAVWLMATKDLLASAMRCLSAAEGHRELTQPLWLGVAEAFTRGEESALRYRGTACRMWSWPPIFRGQPMFIHGQVLAATNAALHRRPKLAACLAHAID